MNYLTFLFIHFFIAVILLIYAYQESKEPITIRELGRFSLLCIIPIINIVLLFFYVYEGQIKSTFIKSKIYNFYGKCSKNYNLFLDKEIKKGKIQEKPVFYLCNNKDCVNKINCFRFSKSEYHYSKTKIPENNNEIDFQCNDFIIKL